MSIATALTALADDVYAARAKITAKGGTITPNGGTSQLADDIDSIPSGGGGVVGTEVIMTSEVTRTDEFAKAIFPSWPNGFEPNSFYVCFWNGLFDGSTPIYSQLGYIAFWTGGSGNVNAQANTCQRYRNEWIGLVGITSNWDVRVSIGDKYTWFKMA